MQRLVSLGMLAAALGGGWMFLKGTTSADVGRVLNGQQVGTIQPVGGAFRQPLAGQANAGVARQSNGVVPPPPPGVLRIATFNIEVFGAAKANKLRGPDGRSIVMAYLAAIVQNFDLVAIQEIRTKDRFFIDNWLRDYVNQGGRRFDRVVGPRLGRTSSKEQYAYVFDTAKVEVNQQVVYTVQDAPADLLHREPLVAMFRAKGAPPQKAFTFMLINTHTDPDETDTELDALAQVYEAVRRHPIGEDDVILLGDLNTAVPSSEPYAPSRSGRVMTKADLRGLGKITGIWPVVRDRSSNTAGNKLHDNLLVHTGATTEFTGRAGVFDVMREYNLTREQADDLSDHLPVWAEFSIYESATPGRVATGAQPTQR